MIKINSKQQKIISVLLKHNSLASSAIQASVAAQGETISLVTIKRTLTRMVKSGILTTAGAGRATVYAASALGRLLAEVDAQAYCSIEPDRRYGFKQYNFDLLSAFSLDIFSDREQSILAAATADYRRRIKDLSATLQKKELERLIIELSWKSSKIEGNTYTLLDTEKLFLNNIAAAGKTKEETQMILNHQESFNFVRTNQKQFKTVSRKKLEELHSIIVNKLNIDRGLRTKPVGITGSIYRPLDNIHQITDALEILVKKITALTSPYVKALFVLAALSYIQPFADGNKRTARLATNGILLAYDLAPLSYRSIDENDYRAAMLTFYEMNSIMPLKKIFMEQYEFAARNYAVK